MDTEYISADEIAAALTEAKDAYYNSDSPIMADAEFDALEERLRELDPEHSYFSLVGALVDNASKIEHAIPLLSMGKAKSVAEVAKWLNRLNLESGSSFILEPKIDGLSATCKYRNGKLVYVATRGDGKIGQDISHITDYVKDIQTSIGLSADEIEIRGELYLPKTTKLVTEGRPLRNICVGLVNRKDEREDLRHVRFAVYKIVGASGFRFESEKIEALRQAGFNAVDFRQVTTIEEIDRFYAHYLECLREQWEYETDGLIVSVNDSESFAAIDQRWVVDHHHHYAIALKAPAEAKISQLRGIDWQVSRQGSLVPVALFEPVQIGGATLERATLNNLDNVNGLKLRLGDELLIERANDVIPFVKENRSSNDRSIDDEADPRLIPTQCPSCETALVKQGVHLKCLNPDCVEKKIQQMLFWVKKSGIENVAEATIRTLYLRGKVQNIKDLYLLTEEDFVGIEGFADKKIANFIAELKKSKSMNARELISKLGIPLVQQRALAKIGINSMDDFLRFNDPTYVIGQNIISWKDDPANYNLLMDLQAILDIQDDDSSPKKGKVCMTGKGPQSRNDLIAEITRRGYEFVDNITKDLDILICEDINASSSKLTKARKNGVKIISYAEFFND